MSTHEQEFDSWALVRAAQSGDRDAFGRLYSHYRPQITRQLTRKVSDREVVADLVSDTFLHALRGLDRVSDTGNGHDLGLWLSVIANRRAYDHYRRRRAVPAGQPGDGLPDRTDPAAGPADRVLDRERRDAAATTISALLKNLTPDQRRVIEQYDLQPHRDLGAVAAKMGRSNGAVRALRDRALRSMRHELATTAGSPTASSDAVPQARRPTTDRATGRGELARSTARARGALAQLRQQYGDQSRLSSRDPLQRVEQPRPQPTRDLSCNDVTPELEQGQEAAR